MYNGTICFNGVKIEFERTQEHCSINGTTVYKDEYIRLIKTTDHYIITDVQQKKQFCKDSLGTCFVGYNCPKAPNGWYTINDKYLYIQDDDFLMESDLGYMFPVFIASLATATSITPVPAPRHTYLWYHKYGNNAQLYPICSDSYKDIKNTYIKQGFCDRSYYALKERPWLRIVQLINGQFTYDKDQVADWDDVIKEQFEPTGLYTDSNGKYVFLYKEDSIWTCQINVTCGDVFRDIAITKSPELLTRKVPTTELIIKDGCALWTYKHKIFAARLGSTELCEI